MITPKTPTVSYHPPHGLSRLPAAYREAARERVAPIWTPRSTSVTTSLLANLRRGPWRRASSFASQQWLKSLTTGGLHVDPNSRRAALVCRTQAEGCGCDQPWRRHADLGAARARRQPPRPGLCRKRRETGRFRRHRPAQQQCFFRNHLCGVEVWRDADLAVLAAAARRSCRGARDSQTRLGGRRRSRLERAQFAARRFRAGRFFRRTAEQPRGALLEGDDVRRLDRTAQGNPRSRARGGRDGGGTDARHPTRRVAAQSRPALSQCAVHPVAHGIVRGRARHRDGEIRRRGGAAPDRAQSGAMGQLRADHDLSSLQIVFHMAAPMPPWLKEKWIAWFGPEKIYELYGGTERQGATVISGVEWLAHRGSVGRIGETSRLRIIGEDGNDVAPGQTGEIYFLPNDGAGSTYHYLGAEPKRRPDGWESTSEGWTPTAISISAIALPT